MKTPAKTNASRLLDKQKIKYELLAYEVDESDLSAATLATKLGQNIRQIFKTLVLRGHNNGIFVCVIPGNEEVDLKLSDRDDCHEGAVTFNRLYPGRLYTNWYEKAVSRIYSRKLSAIRHNLYQCREKRFTIKIIPARCYYRQSGPGCQADYFGQLNIAALLPRLI
jgi:hypothetical protein